MARMSATDIAAKWQRNLGAATQSMKDGVQAVTESPMEKAAAAADRYVAGTARAVEDGRFQDGLRSVSLDEWKRLFLEKGIARIASGAKEAMPKMQQFLAQLLPYTEQISKEIQSMPRGTLADSAARMVANMEKMSQFRFRKRK